MLTRPPVRRRVGDVLAVEQDAPRGRRLEARDQPQERGLAAARGAEEREELAPRDRDRHGVERADLRRPRAEALADARAPRPPSARSPPWPSCWPRRAGEVQPADAGRAQGAALSTSRQSAISVSSSPIARRDLHAHRQAVRGPVERQRGGGLPGGVEGGAEGRVGPDAVRPEPVVEVVRRSRGRSGRRAPAARPSTGDRSTSNASKAARHPPPVGVDAGRARRT